MQIAKKKLEEKNPISPQSAMNSSLLRIFVAAYCVHTLSVLTNVYSHNRHNHTQNRKTCSCMFDSMFMPMSWLYLLTVVNCEMKSFFIANGTTVDCGWTDLRQSFTTQCAIRKWVKGWIWTRARGRHSCETFDFGLTWRHTNSGNFRFESVLLFGVRWLFGV